jgi:hypothetical protein
MAQVSWRAEEWLVQRVKLAAVSSGRSMNEFVTLVLDAATDPANASSESQRIRERLELAGLLAGAAAHRASRPSRAAVTRATRRAATGVQLSDLVSEGR